ncbi:MAG: diguanylate cyclase [Candidatus Omnitrophota bacterium]|nr:diguanylate cyclase [Candidatus Omnitrophota bacterium]MDZ4242662.1 diguanylate cyclase [Candidatus Omnitrophota bacterium]
MKSKQVFVVDDDESVCRALKFLLLAYGFDVDTFPSAEKFLSTVPNSVSGCLILDIHIPGIDGWETQKILVKSGSQRPVIMITVDKDGGFAEQALKAGAVGFLQKPFNDRALVDLVKLATELSSLRQHLKNIEERDDLLFERNLAFSVVIMPDGKIENANKAFLANLNYSKSEIIGQPLINFIVEDERRVFLAQFERCFKGEFPAELEVGIYAKDGSVKTVLFSSTQLLFQEGKEPYSIVVSGVDITARKHAEAELKRSYENSLFAEKKIEQVLVIDQRISAILELHHLIDFIIEKATQILGVQRCSLMILDPDAQELLIKGSKGLDEEVVVNTRTKLGESIAGVVARDGNPLLVTDIEVEPNIARKNSPPYKSKSFLCVPVKLRNKVVGVFCACDKGLTGEDVFTQTDLKIISMIIQQAAIAIENANYCRELEHLSTTDPLTGLYNHRHFMKVLRSEAERSNRYGNPLCLLMFDVDDLKSYNDTYGHLEGDQLLKEISRVVRESLREVDIVCRYAGDEFMVILLETNILQVKAIAEKIKEAVANLKLKREVTLSMGIATSRKNINVHDFILKTDQALYQAKKDGKDGVCCLA